MKAKIMIAVIVVLAVLSVAAYKFKMPKHVSKSYYMKVDGNRYDDAYNINITKGGISFMWVDNNYFTQTIHTINCNVIISVDNE